MYHMRNDTEFSESGVLYVDEIEDGVFSIIYVQPYGGDYLVAKNEVDVYAGWIERDELEDYADDPVETDEDLAIVALDYYGMSEFGDAGETMSTADAEDTLYAWGVENPELP